MEVTLADIEAIIEREIKHRLQVALVANHIREGIVIRSQAERSCLEIGRVQLKLASNNYLSRQ